MVPSKRRTSLSVLLADRTTIALNSCVRTRDDMAAPSDVKSARYVRRRSDRDVNGDTDGPVGWESPGAVSCLTVPKS